MKALLEKLGEALLASAKRALKYDVDESRLKVLISKLPFSSRLILRSAALITSLLPFLTTLLGRKPCTFSSMPVEERIRLTLSPW